MLGDDFAAERAATLGDAVAALQHGGGYSCILLDLLLPGTDRLDAVDAIRWLAPERPIVVLTGDGARGLAVEAMKAGVQDYLYKGDIEPETLRRSVLYAHEDRPAHGWISTLMWSPLIDASNACSACSNGNCPVTKSSARTAPD